MIYHLQLPAAQADILVSCIETIAADEGQNTHPVITRKPHEIRPGVVAVSVEDADNHLARICLDEARQPTPQAWYYGEGVQP